MNYLKEVDWEQVMKIFEITWVFIIGMLFFWTILIPIWAFEYIKMRTGEFSG